MSKLRDYDLWDEDFYDPNATKIEEIASRGKKRKNAQPTDFKKDDHYEEYYS